MCKIITSLLLVSIFKNVLNDEVISTYIRFLSLLENVSSFEITLKAYSDFISKLYAKQGNQNLYLYFKRLLYEDENLISKGCSDCIQENEQILTTATYELKLFDKLFEYDYGRIKELFKEKFPLQKEIIEHIPVYNILGFKNFDFDEIFNSYKKYGYGIFSCYTAFKYNEDKQILPVKYFDTISFSDLKNYEYQKNIIKLNTKAFLENKEANNILLYGDRGCGKSSTVKALVNEFSEYNLKIIQVYKESFIYLFDLYEKLRNLPLKFIIFADDISFEENDKNFSSVKAVLEGSLCEKPSNTIIYATSNRVHMVKESFTSREGSEVHYNDTMDEMVSLSDRFGIILTFSLLNKNEYLDIVSKIANDCCIQMSQELMKKAEEFASLKGIRTPRVARQFITDYIAGL